MNFVHAANCPHCMYHQDFEFDLHSDWQEVDARCRECGAELCLDVSVDVDVYISVRRPGADPERVIDPNQQTLPLDSWRDYSRDLPVRNSLTPEATP